LILFGELCNLHEGLLQFLVLGTRANKHLRKASPRTRNRASGLLGEMP
jgi:hypothetical protein